jgi:hypothetical protein
MLSYVYVTSPLKDSNEPLSFMLFHKFRFQYITGVRTVSIDQYK